MAASINPYDLSEPAKVQLLTLAAESDLLLVGETHGTQEVPRLVLGLLPSLSLLGYNGLALEVPLDQREQLLRCAQGEAAPPPFFGPSDFRDGRGNAQALSLVQQVVSGGWGLLCFDVAFIQEGDAWSVRDRGMARNLLDQWERYCPGRKVVGVCGSYHSRLVPPSDPTDFWPSFAYSVQQERSDLRVSSVNVVFHGGAFFNGEIRAFGPGPEPFGEEAEVRPANWLGHTLDLHLPQSTPVTLLDDEGST